MRTASLRRTARAAACALPVLAAAAVCGVVTLDATPAAGMAPAAAGGALAPGAPQEGQQGQPPAGEQPAAPAEGGAAGTEAAAPQAEPETAVDVPGVGVNLPNVTVELPPGAEWLTDERGQRYYLEEIPKTEPWEWFNDTHVRVRRMEIYEVAEERDDAIVVKIFEQPHGVPTRPRRAPTAEEIAAVAATYRPQAGASDRLRFRPFDQGLPERGQWRNGFDLADMNGDGHLDLVHGPARKGGFGGQPVVFLGDSRGNWRLWEQVRFPPLRYQYGDAAVADFNGDGHPDLALGQHLQGITAMLGDGEGNFSMWSQGLPWELPGQGGAALGFSSRQIAIADWNRDGRPDILAFGEGPRPAREGPHKAMGILPSSSFGVAIFVNQGDGSWRRLDQGLDFGQIFGDHLVHGDFDGDGRLDFATSSNTFGLKNLLGIGGADGGWAFRRVEELRHRAYTPAVAAADFDHDGRLDLAFSTIANQADRWWSAVDVYLARADGWRRVTLHGAEGRTEWATSLAAGDLDGDGHADVVGTTDDGSTWIFLGDGKGGFTREQSDEIPAMPGGCTGYGLIVADLDGDGRDEIVAGFAGEPSAMFAPDRCPSYGALRAWDAEPAAPPAP